LQAAWARPTQNTKENLKKKLKSSGASSVGLTPASFCHLCVGKFASKILAWFPCLRYTYSYAWVFHILRWFLAHAISEYSCSGCRVCDGHFAPARHS